MSSVFESARVPRVIRAALLGTGLAGAATLAACEDERPAEEPATAALSPGIVGHAVGPQPGPDAPMPRFENPYADDLASPVEGRRLFVWYNCYGCHGGRAGGGMGPSLRDSTWLYGDRDVDVFNSIAEGRAYGMPAWGTKLPTSDIWHLVSYIQTLETDSEPDAPPPNRSYPDPPPGG